MEYRILSRLPLIEYDRYYNIINSTTNATNWQPPSVLFLPLLLLIIRAGMIRKLPQSVINEISAGEVIQRPYNVIKELVENSIDAGSTQINVTIQHGGLGLIKIADNGKGIMVEDFPLLCARFATSKIRDFGDMSQLVSFGFRGEALASLSYVSNLAISSKWHQDPVGHSAAFKNQQIQGKILDVPMNTGTVITASDLFIKAESRRASLNPMEEKKKIYKLLCHFCLHYPHIRFSLTSQKGDQGLPRSKTDASVAQSKMQIFQQITKLSYDKLSYIAPLKLSNGMKIESIITKINSCKGKTFMLNINNRIVENVELYKVIEKAYSQCYQSIHEENQSFWVYMSVEIEPRLIDCNVHPTKKAVGLFASEQMYEEIKGLVLDQIKRDSAIKVVRTNAQSEKSLNIQEAFRQRMGVTAMREYNAKQVPTQPSEVRSKPVYAFEKNRTDCKQLPITYYSQSQGRGQNQEPLRLAEAEFILYKFTPHQRDADMKRFFGQCSYVGCYGLNYLLIHFENKLFMLNIVPFVPSFLPSYCLNNKLQSKKVLKIIDVYEQMKNFISKTKLLPGYSQVLDWVSQKESQQLLRSKYGISLQGSKLQSYPCLGDIFSQFVDQDSTIGWEVSYFICRVFNAKKLNKLAGSIEDKFMAEFLSAQFRQSNDNLSPFNEKISNFFKNRVIPILKTNPVALCSTFEYKGYMKQMLDLKDIYKIFQRC